MYPTLRDSLLDCLALCRDSQQNHSLSLSLLRLEFRLLYLLHNFCPSFNQQLNKLSCQESARYLELQQLLRPAHGLQSNQDPQLPHFQKWQPNQRLSQERNQVD